jgi:REP element-mobilizing transposase RayT
MPLRDRPARRNLRLAGWDYRSSGPYAITMVAQNRAWMFGDVVDGRMTHNAAGAMVIEVWREIASAFPRVTLDAFVIMPNHAHAILRLSQSDPIDNPTLGDVVQRFKSITTARYSTGVYECEWEPYDRRLWQQEYYDHIIRDEADLDRCRRYIAANPANWQLDPDREPIHTVDVD